MLDRVDPELVQVGSRYRIPLAAYIPGMLQPGQTAVQVLGVMGGEIRFEDSPERLFAQVAEAVANPPVKGARLYLVQRETRFASGLWVGPVRRLPYGGETRDPWPSGLFRNGEPCPEGYTFQEPPPLGDWQRTMGWAHTQETDTSDPDHSVVYNVKQSAHAIWVWRGAMEDLLVLVAEDPVLSLFASRDGKEFSLTLRRGRARHYDG